MSGAAIATSFLGGEALRDSVLTTWSWFAIFAFGAIAATALVILWPRRDWEFVAGPRRIVATYVETEKPLPLPQIYRDLALHMEDSYDENEVRLQRLMVAFRVAAVSLGVEVLAWVVDLASA